MTYSEWLPRHQFLASTYVNGMDWAAVELDRAIPPDCRCDWKWRDAIPVYAVMRACPAHSATVTR